MKNGKHSADEPEGNAYVAEIMRRHAADARPPSAPKRSRRARTVLVALATILLVLITLNVYLALHRPEVVSPAKEEASARLTVYLVAQAIQTYHDSTRALPRSLTGLGVDDIGITYTPHDPTYTVEVEIGRTRLTYRSGESLDPYRRAALSLLGGLR